jgi:hydroxymethylpyrimidine pyrophosphatase-like HAD family hydrolase
MIKALEQEFPNYDLKYSIGGQISIDVFPNGWDKTYCLKHIESADYEPAPSMKTRPKPNASTIPPRM